MHNNNSNNNRLGQLVFESLEYKDLEGMLKPTIHVDEFSSKMGDDDDIITAWSACHPPARAAAR